MACPSVHVGGEDRERSPAAGVEAKKVAVRSGRHDPRGHARTSIGDVSAKGTGAPDLEGRVPARSSIASVKAASVLALITRSPRRAPRRRPPRRRSGHADTLAPEVAAGEEEERRHEAEYGGVRGLAQIDHVC